MTKKLTPNRVLMLADATPNEGLIVLRAQHGWHTLLAEQTVDLTADDFSYHDHHLTPDHTTLIALIKGMKRLVMKLPTRQTARYELVIVQTSERVREWLTDTPSRSDALVQELAGYADQLMVYFPDLRIETRRRKIIDDVIEKGV
jgi:hypothetical protein